MRVERDAGDPIRPSDLTFDERWGDLPRALVSCWERGREKAQESPDIAAACLRGELPVLAWAGGVAKPLKSGRRAGSLQYLATWQGLRGESLSVDTDAVAQLRCSRTGTVVTFSADLAGLQVPADEEQQAGEWA